MNQSTKTFGARSFKKFCALDGSQYIASRYALQRVLQLIKVFKTSSVLEVGLGIGSFADTILNYSLSRGIKLKYAGTEKNEFCLSALKKNVSAYTSLKIFNTLEDVKTQHLFDLILIDGYDESLVHLNKIIGKKGILFIEGDRSGQRKIIRSIFPKALFVDVISLKKNRRYLNKDQKALFYEGGGEIIFTNPDFKMKLFWFIEKIKTFIKRKIRQFLKRIN